MEKKRTEISTLGEFGLINRIAKDFVPLNTETKLGIGDDAAVIDNGGLQTVITSDMLLEGIHFDLAFMPLQHLGYKAVAVNISDLAAMNAIPKQITVNIGLSNRFSVEAIDEFYKGVKAACDNYKIDLIGGDTTSSASGFVISVTAIGVVSEDRVVKRSGAKVKDVICVTGDLGAAYIGLQVLEREKQVYLANPDMQPQLDKYDYIVQRQLKPEARTEMVYELAEMKVVPTSMIDISDGLASELLHLSSNSGVGMKIYEDKLPIDKQTYDTAFELHIDATTAALNGGEDYELLFTVSMDDMEKLKKHPDIHFIGYVQELSKGNIMVTKGENEVQITAQGWNHFARK
ncbi:Thiamine-monophosphate kinase [Fulvivirga imtechensis AK7]|uniref:Thiamine-monophosphate kinase n=1 Tax=Fulvivirga imtechensis AK7 TaxID=1237149 RepID=L8JKW5_9BACT|nr:thiamine-phosphate kinase [Fulvivirga imtechensis]ELR69440.1 Thiamine-monophosphate kinase [Fulvivirga imtechensis AK7]